MPFSSSSSSTDTVDDYVTTNNSNAIDFRPKRIILLRTGESERDKDNKSSRHYKPDWLCRLTDRGRQQAQDAGHQLNDLISDHNEDKFVFYVSPYERTQEMFHEICNVVPNDIIIGGGQTCNADPRLSQQQKGNYHNVQNELFALTEEERCKFGRFYYRFPNGESGLDVFLRVSSFASSLVRSCMQYKNYEEEFDLNNMNIVIITHGTVLRLFLMRWLQLSVVEYEQSVNPPHGQLICLDKVVSPASTPTKKQQQGDADGHYDYSYEIQQSNCLSLNLPKISFSNNNCFAFINQADCY